jgi:hypothetical protein
MGQNSIKESFLLCRALVKIALHCFFTRMFFCSNVSRTIITRYAQAANSARYAHRGISHSNLFAATEPRLELCIPTEFSV